MGSKLGIPHRMWRLEEKLEMVRLRREENWTPKEISARFGVNRSLVATWCRLYDQYGPERLRGQNGVKRVETTPHSIKTDKV